jgi:hypothetical protein
MNIELKTPPALQPAGFQIYRRNHAAKPQWSQLGFHSGAILRPSTPSSVKFNENFDCPQNQVAFLDERGKAKLGHVSRG